MLCTFYILPSICIKVRLNMLVSRGQVSTRSSVNDMGTGQTTIGPWSDKNITREELLEITLMKIEQITSFPGAQINDDSMFKLFAA